MQVTSFCMRKINKMSRAFANASPRTFTFLDTMTPTTALPINS